MVKLKPSVIHPTSVYLTFIDVAAQANGSTPLTQPAPGDPFTNILGVTSSPTPVYELIKTSKYTIDTEGIIDVGEVYIDIITNNGFNSGFNAESYYEISGDGGNTPFIPIIDPLHPIGSNPDPVAPTTVGPIPYAVETTGRGKWIDNIEIGPDKLQLRVWGRSIDGLPATIAESPFTFNILTLTKKPL
jgi:hypothetical protein